jgi:hypothetical protein
MSAKTFASQRTIWAIVVDVYVVTCGEFMRSGEVQKRFRAKPISIHIDYPHLPPPRFLSPALPQHEDE